MHLKVSEGGLRQMKAWDAFRTGGFLSPRPIPSVLYYARKYFRSKNVFLYLLQNLPFAYLPFHKKNSHWLKLIHLSLLPFTLPFLLICFLRSYRISSEMISKGPIIDPLIK